MAQPATNPKIEELRFRLKTDPKNRIFYPLAEELRKVGQFAEAEQVLRTGLTHHATYLSAWVSLGRVLRDLKNDGAAAEALAKALQLDPGNVVAARLLADSYMNLGEKVEAIKKYKLVQALMPGDEEVDAIVERLEAELNPQPPIAETPAAAKVDVAPTIDGSARPDDATTGSEISTSPFAADDSPFAAEESPFAAEGENAPFQATTEMPFAQQFDTSAEPEAPFAQAPEVGEETATMRPARRILETPFAGESEPESTFSAEVAAAHADEVPFSAPESDLNVEPAAAAPAETAPPSWPAPTATDIFTEAAQALHREMALDEQTGDVVPMSVEHAESPFEEPTSYGEAAFEIESPDGMHISGPPVAADVPRELPADEFTRPEPALLATEPAIASTVDESDVFAPAEEPSPADAAGEEDLTNTLTMADLYARQGLTAEARQIYENILHRDSTNEAVRSKLADLDRNVAPAVAAPSENAPAADQASPVSANDKVAKLERWLSRVGKREVGSV